jgi:hypothetical protein
MCRHNRSRVLYFDYLVLCVSRTITLDLAPDFCLATMPNRSLTADQRV